MNRYFMEGHNADGIWKNAEKLVEFKFGFRFVFILLAVAERDGSSLQGSHLNQKLMTLEPVMDLSLLSPRVGKGGGQPARI